MSYTLLQGDCVEVMRTLPASSVQCCVTSPPYFGLRDYGTAEWEGGDTGCDHVERFARNDGNRQGENGFAGSANREGHADMGAKQFRDVCGKCGARRIDQQIGLEETPEAYVAKLVEVFREVRRLLHPTGVLFLNLGDSYAGSGKGGQSEEKRSENWQPTYANKGACYGLKPKDLIGIPWAVAFALRADGWWLRSEIIWHKRAPMPESVTDRPTKAHEQVFLLAKSASYYYDAEAIKEPSADPQGSAKRYESAFFVGPKHEAGGYSPDGAKHTPGMKEFDGTRNKRSVWTLGPESFPGAHFATMPTKLVEPCILAGSKVGDTVLDPFNGSGTTGAVALKHHRNYVGIDLNPAYLELAHDRIRRSQPTLLEVTA